MFNGSVFKIQLHCDSVPVLSYVVIISKTTALLQSEMNWYVHDYMLTIE
jgi:hypothetical protein